MARNRSSSPKPFRFSQGSSVEVRSSDIGFQGAWYEATIIRTPLASDRRYYVKYLTLVVDDSNAPLRESVPTTFVRPRPPLEPHSSDVFGLHQLVEAFHNDGWWPGVVIKLPRNCDGLYSVCFPTSREEFEFKASELRRRLEWIKAKWVSVEDCIVYDKEGGHVMFSEGARVEVSRDRENFGAAWFVGTVVKFIGMIYFLVEFENIKVDAENCTKSSLKEIVDLQYIRPCPPMSESTSFNVLDEVEVFCEDGWHSGSVSVILPGSRYIIKYKHKEDDITVHHTSLRPHFVWTDGHWVHISKDNDKEFVAGSDISSRTGVKPGLEIGDEFSRPLKMLKKGNLPNERSQSAGEIESDIQTSRKWKSHGRKRSVRRVPMLTSCNSDGETANKKVGEPSFDEDNSSQRCTTDANMEDSHVMPQTEPLSPTAKLPEPLIEPAVHVHSDLILCESMSDKLRMLSVGPACNGSSLSIVDNFCNEGDYSPIRLLSKKAFGEVENSGSILPSEEHISDNHKFEDMEMALIDPYPMVSSSKKMMLPLTKISEMSELVKSALNLSPQQPHFRPLLKHGKELREGLSCGLMMAFASLVTGLCNLRIIDSEQDFEEKLKVLDTLEKHGFTIQPLRARLEKLLEIRNKFGQLEKKKNSMGTQVQLLEAARGEDDLLLSKLEKSVAELEERLACVREDRASVMLKIKKSESEIVGIKARVRAAEKKSVSTQRQFIVKVTAPW